MINVSNGMGSRVGLGRMCRSVRHICVPTACVRVVGRWEKLKKISLNFLFVVAFSFFFLYLNKLYSHTWAAAAAAAPVFYGRRATKRNTVWELLLAIFCGRLLFACVSENNRVRCVRIYLLLFHFLCPPLTHGFLFDSYILEDQLAIGITSCNTKRTFKAFCYFLRVILVLDVWVDDL